MQIYKTQAHYENITNLTTNVQHLEEKKRCFKVRKRDQIQKTKPNTGTLQVAQMTMETVYSTY